MRPPRENRTNLIFAGGLFFASGLAGLLLQTFWLRRLGHLLGASALTGTVVLTLFFAGLALGAFFMTRRPITTRPLRTYALLEALTALGALAIFALEGLFVFAYGPLANLTAKASWLMAPLTLLIAAPVLLPATIPMGATLPVMSEYLKKTGATAGRVTVLYALNIFGGAAGIVLASFVLPRLAGYTTAYLCAVALLFMIAAAAAVGSRAMGSNANNAASQDPKIDPEVHSKADATEEFGPFDRDSIAFVSGFVVLACEIFWMRLFARLLQNSVYTHALVLLVVLLGLGGGTLLARLAGRRLARPGTMAGVMLLASLATVLGPWIIHAVTGGLAYFGGDSDWTGYLLKIFGLAAAAILPAAFLLGLVFPLLFAAGPVRGASWQATTGRLVGINTVGSIGGAALAGFLLLPGLGLFASLRFAALIYPALLLILLARLTPADRRRVAIALAVIFLLIGGVIDPGRLPAVRFRPDRGESLVDVRESPRGQSAVISKRGDLRIKLDNHYTIGGTAARAAEERQSHLPLLLHGDPRRVFVLGLGTGITAGAVLRHPVRELTVAELVPEIAELSKLYFEPFTGGLFKDERARVIAADGRWWLRSRRGAADGYDLVIADLFTPWKAGVGDLYTREHFETVRERLAPGGLFAQWLPLFQMTDYEFGVTARTMLAVFPRVTLWRGDFFADRSIVALVGHRDRAPLDPEPARARLAAARADERDRLRDLAPALAAVQSRRDAKIAPLASLLMYYAGDLSARANEFKKFPTSSDDRPLVSWSAPISQRRVRAGRAEWIGGARLLKEFEATFAAAGPDGGDYLSRLNEGERRYVRAGLMLHRLVILKEAGDREAALEELRALKKVLAK